MIAPLVVDSSVVIKWFVSEPLTVESTAILTAYQAGTLTLLAPDLIYAELGNIIWKKHTLQGLSSADAARINGISICQRAYNETQIYSMLWRLP